MRPRILLRIARWEATKGVRGFDRGAIAVVLACLAFVFTVGLVVSTGGVALEDGIYRVGVAADDPLYEPVEADPAFAVVEPDDDSIEDGHLVAGGPYDLHIESDSAETRLYPAVEGGQPTEKSLAAIATLGQSVDRFNDRQLAAEANQTAAFPVTVTVQYVERDGRDVLGPGGPSGNGDGGDRTDDTDEGDGTDESGGVGERGGDGRLGAPSLGAFDLFGTGGTTGSPSDLAPPFPFQSLVLAFLFVLPLNFIIQAYGSTMLSERLNRRGELLLVSPVSRGEIVFGKTLPYFAASLVITVLIVAGLWLLGGRVTPLSVVAVVPLALLFLATTFLGAMFARSFRELTFVTVTLSVFLTSFAFVPAIFADMSPIAYVSPLTLVVRDLTASGVTAGQFIFATMPSTLAAGICFLFGLGVYREEDLFTQRPVHLKALDSLAGRIHRERSVALVVALLVPFVFVAELLAVALLFALPVAVSVPLVFFVIAVIEELAKGVPIYAGFVHTRYDRTLGVAATVGTAAGIGFFIAEKGTLVVQLVGLPQLAVADAAFQTGFGTGSLAVIALLALAPLGLHVVTATISALGARRGRTAFVMGLSAAILVHLGYNLLVVSRFV